MAVYCVASRNAVVVLDSFDVVVGFVEGFIARSSAGTRSVGPRAYTLRASRKLPRESLASRSPPPRAAFLPSHRGSQRRSRGKFEPRAEEKGIKRRLESCGSERGCRVAEGRECAFLETACDARSSSTAGNDSSAKWPSEGMRATNRSDARKPHIIQRCSFMR